MHQRFTRALATATALALTLMPAGPAFAHNQNGDTTTPIKHLVVIFQENISFDHYFGTYPSAQNLTGEVQFQARKNTPTVNGYGPALLVNNPNLNAANGTGATNPFRLSKSQAVTADQNHAYGPEQSAFDMGLMDLFPLNVGNAGTPPNAPPMVVVTKGLNLGYYDGNTVTGLWNYAQHFAMSDNSYGSTFGPSTVGLMNLVAGQTNGVAQVLNPSSSFETPGGPDGNGNATLTVINDPDPFGDVCANPNRNQVQMNGQNIGDLLTTAGITWGSFMGGFDLTAKNSNGTSGCNRSSTGLAGTTADYIPHHAFFQYWASTANPMHTRPASATEIGNAGPANHNYDVNDFYAAIKTHNIPAVSFIKAPAIQDGHAGYSDPVDEQTFMVNLVNMLQKSNEWSSTAIVIAYDDSDGWYDHQMGPIVNQSASPADTLTGAGSCGNGALALGGPNGNLHAQGRCGFGPRLPLVVISGYAKKNFVDHSLTNQTSIIRFVEDNWLQGQRIDGSFDAVSGSIDYMFDFDHFRDNSQLILDPGTGAVVSCDED
jgi:phospholipase C